MTPPRAANGSVKLKKMRAATQAAALVRNTTLEPYRTLTLYPVSPASELEAHSKVVLATIGVESAGLAGIGPVVFERLVGQVQQVER